MCCVQIVRFREEVSGRRKRRQIFANHERRLHLPTITGDEPTFTYNGVTLSVEVQEHGLRDYLYPSFPVIRKGLRILA